MKPRIEDLTKKEKLELAKAILRICEKQYRKGYQQGIHHFIEGRITVDQANEFRSNGSDIDYKKVVYPPEMKRRVDPVDRILPELMMGGTKILRNLFSDLEDDLKK